MTATRIVNRLRSRISEPRDAGFTLIETVIALSIAAFVFMSLAAATMMALKGGLNARQNQMAADMIVQSTEKVRALDFINTAHTTLDGTISGSPHVSGGKFDPGTGVAEDLIFLPTGYDGPLNPHMTQETYDATQYTIYRYVTAPAGYTTDTRRLTVIVEWTVQGQTKSQQNSTLLTETRRGLPLPRFLFSASSGTARTQGPGTEVVYGFKLHNYGARDTWNLDATGFGAFTYYKDLDADGAKGTLDTIALTDTDADGRPDTGPVEVDADAFFLAVATAPNSEGSFTGSVSVQSSAQPSADTAIQTVDFTLTTSGAPPPPTGTGKTQDPWPVPQAECGATACSLPTYYFHELPLGDHANNGSNTSTLDTNSTQQAAAHDFSVGKPGAYGRYVERGGSVTTETNRDRVADWRYQAPVKEDFAAGTAVVTLYVGCLTGVGALPVDVAIGTATSSSLGDFSSKGVGTATLLACDSSFAPIHVAVPISSKFSVTKNRYLAVRATIPGFAPSDIRVAYDWPGADSNAVIPK